MSTRDLISGSAACPVFKYPIVWNASKTTLLFTMGFNGSFQSVTMTIDPIQSYWVTNDGQSGSQITDLLSVFATKMRSQYGLTTSQFRAWIDDRTQCVVLSGSDSFSISGTLSTFPFEWFGFTRTDVGATGGGILCGSYPPAGTWVPQRLPSSDTYDMAKPVREVVGSVGGRTSTYRFDRREKMRDISFRIEPRNNVVTSFCDSPSGSFETMYREGLAKGRLVRVYDQRRWVSSSIGYRRYVTSDPMAPGWDQDTNQGIPFYDLTVSLFGTENDI